MMLKLSRQTVRHSWQPYVGALVALVFGIALLSVAVTVGGAVDTTGHRAGLSVEERAQLSDLASLFGLMSGVALFMAIFVVGSTFGFVVATRRRQLGLLRLVGATPRQVRRMVLGESAVVAVVAAVVGSLVGMLAAPAFLEVMRWKGLLTVDLDLPAPWLAWTIAAPIGIAVALLGAWRSSKRASRVSPVAVFQEAGLERRRPGLWQLVIGVLCLGGTVAALVLAHALDPVFALVMSILVPEVAVIGLYCLGGWIFPGLAGLVARPFVRRDVSARLARDHVRTAVRTPVALAAPILAISAVAGSMILALSFTADWVTALDREQLATPYVVETNGDASVGDRLADVPLADPRVSVVLPVGAEHDLQDVDVVDPATAPEARTMKVVKGDLSELDHGVVITRGWSSDSGVHLGDKLLGARVVAVVQDAPDLYSDVIVPPSLVPQKLRDTTPQEWFVDPGSDDLAGLLEGTDADVLTKDAWLDQVDQQTRENNNLGLWILLGPAGLYAAIAIVNSVLVGASQRRAQLRTIALLGATRDQLRRMALWEAGLVGAAALLVGGVVTAVVGWTVRSATAGDVANQPLTFPWLPLSAIVATCVGLTLVAAYVGSRRSGG
ncbi:MAG TPA: FtsX-like permease family protein [Nocardioides sp.]|uniref:FtsX-like permease family protein n=1 Tax=Nocardioides sp. TaxID=35761 RepID=UPI002E371C39|nr:FtsX-like permease family protein [Nocardioides sp.]HEX5090765.1 FtsX-like permease family protein [Nocardioides sp.]